MQENMLLPIAEHFHSLQGEGTYTGTPMHFIRLAGCSVGRSPEKLAGSSVIPMLPLRTGNLAWGCCTYDGRQFMCDTDFSLKEKLSVDALLDETWEDHVCLTGGEPLVHVEKVKALINECGRRGIGVHIETSGTIDFYYPTIWITVSPKLGATDYMLHKASEIKLLVDEHFDLNKLPFEVKHHPNVWVQPINGELTLDKDNLHRCMDIIRVHPAWKVSVQMHKLVGLR